MSPPPVAFTRVVLGFGQGAVDRPILRFAADFARLLRLDLHGVFAEDPRLAHLAGLASLREFRVLEGRWRPVEGRSLVADLEMCAAIARQSFDEIARAMGVARGFEVVQAPAREAIASVSAASDIVMVAEPGMAAHFALESFSETVAAALATPAAVLVVPKRVIREHGRILAVSETADDASVAGAAAIAAASHERFEVIAAQDRDVSALWQRPDLPGERMIVMSRRVSNSLSPLSVVSRRRVPVLVLGSGRFIAAEPS